MSYILEALNKSEQERRGSKTPDINTIHRAPPGKRSKGVPWLAIIVVFGLLNSAALGYWLWSKPGGAATVADTARAQLPTPAPTQSEPAEVEAAPQNVRPTPSTTTPEYQNQPTVITPTSVYKPGQQALRITELPTNVQRQIPNLIFSSHLYSDDADFRMVNINGKMIREGDVVANDLRLLEITEEGVILGYLHYVFEVSVLRDWSFN
jgi:general secretion pathway protein B